MTFHHQGEIQDSHQFLKSMITIRISPELHGRILNSMSLFIELTLKVFSKQFLILWIIPMSRGITKLHSFSVLL